MQCEVNRTGRTEPEVFALAGFPPVAVETVDFGREGFSQEKLAFVKGPKWDGTSRIGALMQHRLGPVFSGREQLRPGDARRSARWLPTRRFN